MSKEEFYNRPGATPYDTYLLLGTNDELVKAEQEIIAAGQNGKVATWKTPNQKHYNSDNGISSKDGDYFGFLNSDNLNVLHEVRDQTLSLYKYSSTSYKMALVVQHEATHPKLSYRDKDANWHIPGDTIMDEKCINEYYDQDMIFRLQWLHNYQW